jgi:CBS domain-containing protein
MLVPLGAHALLTIVGLLLVEFAVDILAEILRLHLFVLRAEIELLLVISKSDGLRHCAAYVLDLFLELVEIMQGSESFHL